MTPAHEIDGAAEDRRWRTAGQRTVCPEAEHEADHVRQTLKLGVGIDIGHHIVEGIAEIPGKAFKEVMEKGVRIQRG